MTGRSSEMLFDGGQHLPNRGSDVPDRVDGRVPVGEAQLTYGRCMDPGAGKVKVALSATA